MVTAAKRQTLVEHAAFMVKHNANVGYPGEQANGTVIPFRPMPLMHQSREGMARLFAAGAMWYPDCSSFIAWLCCWAGLQDPTGNRYDGSGNSLSMWQHLAHYTELAHAQAGALVVFGVQGANHVCVVTKPGATASTLRVCSHGSAAGPLDLTLEEEAAAHQGQALTMLDISSL